MNTENNKIIAEFMGYKLANCSNGMAWENTLSKKSQDDKFKLHGRLWRENDTYYKWNSDWNWLMEVVEKIESLDYNFNITSGDATALHYHCAIYQTSIYRIDGTTKIQATYETVIEFIKWYNLQK